MKFISLAAASVLAFALPAFSLPAVARATESLTYDLTYDNPAYPLTNVACSNGVNGLLTKGYKTLGDIPTFPYLGGMSTVTGWNSTACGACYAVTYGSTTINAVAVDYAGDGLNLSKQAMIALAGQAGINSGKIQVTVTAVDASVCGMH